MKLYAYVHEARGLPEHKRPQRAPRGVYVKLKVGKHKSRTGTAAVGPGDPAAAVWNEEFVFPVEDDECEDDGAVELKVTVYRLLGDDGREELLGRARILVEETADAAAPAWFALHPRHHRRRGKPSKSKGKECGEILLTRSLYGRFFSTDAAKSSSPLLSLCNSPDYQHLEELHDSCSGAPKPGRSSTLMTVDHVGAIDENGEVVSSSSYLTQRFHDKIEESLSDSLEKCDALELSDTLYSKKICKDTDSADVNFIEAMEIFESRNEIDMPENLQGGIVLEQTYLIDPKDLNCILFKPNSRFRRDLAVQQGMTDYEEKPWTWKSSDKPCLARLVTYTNPASKFVKAVQATEEQTYVKASRKEFAVLVRVSTPDVPYGNCFQVILLYKIMPGPVASSGEETSHLVISWNIDFHQNTIMKKIIEGTARQGLKESFENFAAFLSQHAKQFSPSLDMLNKEQLLVPLQLDHQSDWKLAFEYFCNFKVVFTLFLLLYIILHILLSGRSEKHGLEFDGLDLPDTFSELIINGILFLHLQHVYNMVVRFLRARVQRGSDHGVKAQGDGWLLTVALIEGKSLPSAGLSGFPDSYVVFSCNGKTRTSSVQLQSSDPQWNEVLQFDAMPEPPSVLDVEVFDFDGPFDLDISLGHVEINFLKYKPEELADMWIPLEIKLNKKYESRLHLRIFVHNTKGEEAVKEYLQNMEKEVGKKLHFPSPQKNSTFQKIFALPPEEFLINDFSCYLMRRMPLQGRLFLSARVIGFYANLFGHKTKFFFLWEDIEDIQMISPSLATLGSPAILIKLRNARGLAARHGAKTLDGEGRLKFQFQAFVSFEKASRTIMTLWRTKALAIEQAAKLKEDQDDHRTENVESISSDGGTNLTKTCSLELPLSVNELLEVFGGNHLEYKIMNKVGCLNYTVSKWRTVEPDIYERNVSYKFNTLISVFGGEVISNQRKAPAADGDGWIIDEIMTIHNIPFGDHFRIHLTYKFGTVSGAPRRCWCKNFVSIDWMKSMKFRKRIAKNICDKLVRRSKDILELAEKEALSEKAQANG